MQTTMNRIDDPKTFSSIRATRVPGVSEREIFRVVALLPHGHRDEAFRKAQREVLLWVKNRAGGELPKEAWEGDEFDLLDGGRMVLATRLKTELGNLWAIRSDDPDKRIAGRIWTTEVTIGKPTKGPALLGLRLLASSSETELVIDPHVPGLLRQVSDACGLSVDGYVVKPTPSRVMTDQGMMELVSLLQDQTRRLPVIVASGDERKPEPSVPLLDAGRLASATLGLAHTVVVPAHYSYRISEEFGRVRSCFHGAVRVYMPRFDGSADPFDHPLFVGDQVEADPDECDVAIRRIVSRESLRTTRLGEDLWTFSELRSAASRLEVDAARAGKDVQKQLVAASRYIRNLEVERETALADVERHWQLATEHEDRAKEAEATQRGLRARVQAYVVAFSQHNLDPDDELEFPQQWTELVDWCDTELAGRLVLGSQARKGIKKAEFESVNSVAECLLWLASKYRDTRMCGGGTTRNMTILNGIENAPCGDDTFRFEWQQRYLRADWHVKTRGNTRDPRRCLRIYYCFDDTTQQVIVADMPRHRRTSAT